MPRHDSPALRSDALDGHAYATLDGRKVTGRPTLYRPDDGDEQLRDEAVIRMAAAREVLNADPALLGVFAQGQSLASLATAAGQHRSTALRRFRAYLAGDVRRKIVAELVCLRSLREGGGTFDARTGTPVLEDAWAVGLRDFSRQSPTLTPAVAEDFLRDGFDDLAVGTFLTRDTWYLDRVRLVRDEAEALRLGWQERQEAIFHLGTRRLLWIGRRDAA